MLKHIKYIRLQVNLTAMEQAVLPHYLGSLLRGVIGTTFKKVCCTNYQKECPQCDSWERCPYSNSFNCIDKNSEEMLKGVHTIPNPFIILPLTNNKTEYLPSDSLSFQLTLLGKSCSYIHYFIHAINEIQKLGLGVGRKKFSVESIIDVDEEKYIVKDGRLFFENLSTKSFVFKDRNANMVTFEFITPLRVIDDGKVTDEITFHLLLRNIFRRISTISYYHMDYHAQMDYNELLEKAKTVEIESQQLLWNDLKRYSNRSNRKLFLGGVTGKITFKGSLSEFVPYIEAGKMLHIGKGCTMGLGHYRTVYL